MAENQPLAATAGKKWRATMWGAHAASPACKPALKRRGQSASGQQLFEDVTPALASERKLSFVGTI